MPALVMVQNGGILRFLSQIQHADISAGVALFTSWLNSISNHAKPNEEKSSLEDTRQSQRYSDFAIPGSVILSCAVVALEDIG